LYTIPLKRENLKVVQDALADVVRSGTARRAFAGASYQAAGKTGTAQVYSLHGSKYHAGAVDERLRDHALFMAYAPVDDPKIALALIVENGGWGASVAAPIARKVFDYWLSPDRKDAAANPAAPAAKDEAPDDGVGESPDAVVKPEDLPPDDSNNGSQDRAAIVPRASDDDGDMP